MKKTVLLVSFSPLRRDPRVLRQLRLLRGDYRVSTCGFGSAPDGVEEHFEIPLTESGWWPKDLKFAGAYLAARSFKAFHRHEPRVKAALGAVPSGRFDVIIANDLNTVALALMLRPRCGVHADLHEWEPRVPGAGLKWRMMGHPYARWQLNQLKRVASVTTVAPGIAEAYEREYGVRAGVVTNAADYVDLEPTDVGTPLRLIHSGGSNPGRRLDLLIDAMRGVKDSTLELMLMSTGEGTIEALKAHAADVPNVSFRDPVPYADLVRTLNDYDVGVFLLPPTSFNNEMALPNKIFEFVQARLGVVVGPSPEIGRLVRQHDVGVVADDFTPEALRAAIEGLTPDAVRQYKKNSQVAAKPLASEAAIQPWLDAVRRIATSH